MNACIFVGPTLRPGDLEGFESILPPVAQGDVYRASQGRPRAIGIIDGYFDGVPAVWHKEILWAMAEGIHVFGSASMGALRAAELASFGMIGIGTIFEDYRDGRLEDDDEVAVLHGPAETGYLPLSEPMVNVRATLERALGERLVGSTLRDRLLGIAKSMFYRERTWPAVLERASANGQDRDRLERLSAWLDEGRVDRKRADALAMLHEIRTFLHRDPTAKRVGFHFEWTAMWDDAVRAFEAGGEASGGAPGTGALVLEELKLRPGAWQRAHDAALARLWSRREADRRRLRPSPAQIDQALVRLRERHGLYTRQALDVWLAESDLDPVALERLLLDEVRREMLEEAAAPQIDDPLLDQLRIDGSYAQLARRARAKAECLRSDGATDADPCLIGMAPLALRRWFFEDCLGQPVPDDVAAFARASGFADAADFDGALVREYLYCEAAAGGAEG
ncbi:MAG: TfuA domain protein core [Geminicoccaceae bacterium]|jgi:hypothetical protein|nr:TfuA domain protein core [Geminicoccaceae bacterium]